MADHALTERDYHSWGSLKAETGGLTKAGTSVTIHTKLSRVIFFEITSMENTEDSEFAVYINSLSASTVEDDGGFVFMADSGMADGEYTYFATGVG